MKPSVRPSNRPGSEAPPGSARLGDSRARLFMGRRYYYRQIGDLAVNLCAAKTISDDDWEEYLYGSLAVARELGRGPNASIIEFAGGGHPNAGQRKKSAEFLVKERVRPIDRVAIFTENDLLRGAVTAFGWLVPKMKYRSFRPSDVGAALAWLGEIAHFDREKALSAWAEARETLGIETR